MKEFRGNARIKECKVPRRTKCRKMTLQRKAANLWAVAQNHAKSKPKI